MAEIGDNWLVSDLQTVQTKEPLGMWLLENIQKWDQSQSRWLPLLSPASQTDMQPFLVNMSDILFFQYTFDEFVK